MIELTEELKYWNEKMYEAFGTRIPLRQIPSGVSNEELYTVVRQSLEQGENLLPKLFGYDNTNSTRLY